MRHNPYAKKLGLMNPVQRLEYMATAKKVTVGEYSQVINGQIVDSFIAKIRGVPVSRGDQFQFDTPDQAREFGKSVLETWRKEYQALVKLT